MHLSYRELPLRINEGELIWFRHVEPRVISDGVMNENDRIVVNGAMSTRHKCKQTWMESVKKVYDSS